MMRSRSNHGPLQLPQCFHGRISLPGVAWGFENPSDHPEWNQLRYETHDWYATRFQNSVLCPKNGLSTGPPTFHRWWIRSQCQNGNNSGIAQEVVYAGLSQNRLPQNPVISTGEVLNKPIPKQLIFRFRPALRPLRGEPGYLTMIGRGKKHGDMTPRNVGIERCNQNDVIHATIHLSCKKRYEACKRSLFNKWSTKIWILIAFWVIGKTAGICWTPTRRCSIRRSSMIKHHKTRVSIHHDISFLGLHIEKLQNLPKSKTANDPPTAPLKGAPRFFHQDPPGLIIFVILPSGKLT